MYRELIEKLIEGHSWAKLQAPCSEKDITKAEKFVGFSFPEELKALLRETNGDRNFLLSAEEIISNTMHSAAHSGRWCGGPAAAVRFKQRPKLVSYIRFNHHGVVLCCTL